MNLEKLINKTLANKVEFISADDLQNLFEKSEIEVEEDSVINGKIRILKYGKKYIFQETTNKNEIVIRIFNSLKKAKALLDDRMKVYENMWNGCGCKVKYYE